MELKSEWSESGWQIASYAEVVENVTAIFVFFIFTHAMFDFIWRYKAYMFTGTSNREAANKILFSMAEYYPPSWQISLGGESRTAWTTSFVFALLQLVCVKKNYTEHSTNLPPNPNSGLMSQAALKPKQSDGLSFPQGSFKQAAFHAEDRWAMHCLLSCFLSDTATTNWL